MRISSRGTAVAARPSAWNAYLNWLALTAVFALLESGVIWSLMQGSGWTAAPLVVLVAFVMHGQLMALHEAAHGLLVPIRWWNDAIGVAIGTLSFTTLSAYRAMHRTHHAWLASPQDEELWPFVDPATSRAFRRACLLASLLAGLAFTPALCLRTFLRRGSSMTDRSTRLRTWAEYGLMAGAWSVLLVTVARLDAWGLLLAGFVAPAVLAGNIHGFRQAIEHVGLGGSTPLDSTRSIVPRGPLARLTARAWFNIGYHGAHHASGSHPHAGLPQLHALLGATSREAMPTYSSYLRALRAARAGLADPRAGRQWETADTPDVRVVG